MRTFVLLCITLAGALLVPGRPRPSRALRGIDHIVVIYEENHSFDNLYGGWEGVDGLNAAPAAGQPGGRAYKCLLQNDVNLAAVTAAGRRTLPGEAFASHFPNAPFQIDDFIAADGHDLPGAGHARAQRRAQGQRPAGRLHARPRPPLLPGAVPAQRRAPEPLRDGLGRRRPDDGPLRHAQAADLQVPARAPTIRATRSPTASSRRAFGGSFLNHQWLVAAATPDVPGAPTAPTSTRCRRATGCRRATRSTRPTGPVQRHRADAGVPAGRDRPRRAATSP